MIALNLASRAPRPEIRGRVATPDRKRSAGTRRARLSAHAQPKRTPRPAVPARRALSATPAVAATAAPTRQRARVRNPRTSTFKMTVAAISLVSLAALSFVAEAAAATQASYRINMLKAQQTQLLADQELERYRISLASSAGRLDGDATRLGLVVSSARQYLPAATDPVALATSEPATDAPVGRSFIDQLAVALGRPTEAQARDR